MRVRMTHGEAREVNDSYGLRLIEQGRATCDPRPEPVRKSPKKAKDIDRDGESDGT